MKGLTSSMIESPNCRNWKNRHADPGDCTGLYIHVPFCRSLCAYCDFYSERLEQPARACSYLDALEKEIQGIPSHVQPGTVFIGGGTPTALDAPSLRRLLAMVKDRCAGSVTEWSCEANPGTLTAHKIELLKRAGVNRISLGVQTFDAQQLALLGRAHSAQAARDAVRLLRRAGFDNLSLDLMYGIPGESLDLLSRDVDELLALQPDHVSAYALTLEEGTPLERDVERGRWTMPEDELCAEQYARVCQRLQEAGFEHYEISNFALPGRECRHNLLYWGPGEFYGCGPAAHSHIDGERWGNVEDTAEYCRRLQHGLSPKASSERLPPEARARESLIMGLRRIRGFSLAEIIRAAGCALPALEEDVRQLIAEGRLIEEEGRLRLPRSDLFVSDDLFRRLV